MVNSRKIWFIRIFFIMMFLCGVIIWMLYPSSQYPSINTITASDYKQTIHIVTKNLYLVAAELNNHTHKNPWIKDSLDVLTKTIALLETMVKTENIINNSSQKILLVKRTKTDKTVTVPEVCPDKFVHANLSEPYFVNGSWVRINCTKEDKLVKDILTVLLYPSQSTTCTENTNILIQRIRNTHPGVPIIVAADVKKCSVDQQDVVVLNTQSTSAETWNKLVDKVTTKYILFGRGLDNFSWLTKIERQLAMLSDANAQIDIVSGAFRNKTGHWEVGCYQSQLKFYQLIYTDGYYKSKNECMFCDYVKGPFIARKSLFQNINFDTTMLRNVIFEDFFLRLNRNDSVVICPDAMYFATDETTNDKLLNRRSWLPLVKKMELNRVVIPENVRHRYTCEESGTSCSGLKSKTGQQYMPVCCMDRAVYGLKLFHEYCVKHDILYYVIGGTALGAIKFRDIIPWDFDGDVVYYLANESFFEHNKTPFSNEKTSVYFGNFHQKRFGYFNINTHNFIIEMFGLNDTANEHVGMTQIFTKMPTKVRIRGEWFYGPPSPGLYARQQYGKELLKHANSWITQGHLWFNPYKTQSSFRKCIKPGHHFCYDTSPTDGSFGFAVP